MTGAVSLPELPWEEHAADALPVFKGVAGAAAREEGEEEAEVPDAPFPPPGSAPASGPWPEIQDALATRPHSSGLTVEALMRTVRPSLGRVADALADTVTNLWSEGSLSRYATDEPPTQEQGQEWSVSHQLAVAHSGAQRLGGRLAERVATAQGGLDEAMRNVGGSWVGGVASSSHAGLEPAPSDGEVWPQPPSSGLLKQLKFAPLSASEMAVEFFGGATQAAEGATEVASIAPLSRQCWELWRQKHAALTASESLYASLLADSRRTAVLAAEIEALEEILEIAATARRDPATPSSASTCEPEAVGDSSRQAAFGSCCKAVEAQELEAAEAFRERVKNYPCGCTSQERGRDSRLFGQSLGCGRKDEDEELPERTLSESFAFARCSSLEGSQAQFHLSFKLPGVHGLLLHLHSSFQVLKMTPRDQCLRKSES